MEGTRPRARTKHHLDLSLRSIRSPCTKSCTRSVQPDTRYAKPRRSAMGGLKFGLSFQAHETQADGFTSQPTAFASWGFDELNCDAQEAEPAMELAWGALVGCEDGTLYIFHPDLSRPKYARRKSEPQVPNRRPSNPNVLDISQLPYRRPHHLSLSRSRDASPLGSKSNLAVAGAQKSRAVSGLSKEQVEAPKNFVDFEDEQERMKEMISDRAVKDAKDRSPRASVAPYDSPRRRPIDDTLSLASIETSLSRYTPPASPPLSPPLESTTSVSYQKSLALRIQIVPRQFGMGHEIIDIIVLAKEGLFLVLQKSG